MNELIIELDRVSLPREFLGVLREEFESGGLHVGRVAIGDITAIPEMVYFLWHDSGEMPVSKMIERVSFKDEAGTREAARSFIRKWNERFR